MTAQLDASSIHFLAILSGGQWRQCLDIGGNVFYAKMRGQECEMTMWGIPPGFEDLVNDRWNLFEAVQRPQWRNARTNRVVLIEPKPPRTGTYLDSTEVNQYLSLYKQLPDRIGADAQPLKAILIKNFSSRNGFWVSESNDSVARIPELVVSSTQYTGPRDERRNFVTLIALCTRGEHIPGWYRGFLSGRAHEVRHETQYTYCLVQRGWKVTFYKLAGGPFELLDREDLDLVQDANAIKYWCDYIKANPLPLFYSSRRPRRVRTN